MEEDIRKLCIGITEILLADENGWLFAEPVDPVRDGCPTYFSVIKHPMDLGTILVRLGFSLHFRQNSIQTSTVHLQNMIVM